MAVFYSVSLALAAFWLGACPFSVWLGRWFLKKDITRYGDGNPGAANVFRAGSAKLGIVAVLMDIIKGIPFVYLSYAVFELPMASVIVVGLSAILGHAFSPLLHFRGGKAIAVTFGVVIALPQFDVLLVFALSTVLGFLFLEQHSWAVMPGPIGTTVYLLINRGGSWELVLMLCTLALYILKQYDGLRSTPRFKTKLIDWLLQSRRGT
jgi:glycerol-3-phosphate acyltransferase PlsY